MVKTALLGRKVKFIRGRRYIPAGEADPLADKVGTIVNVIECDGLISYSVEVEEVIVEGVLASYFALLPPEGK